MTHETFATIQCEIGYEPEDGTRLPTEEGALKRRIAAAVAVTLDSSPELMVFGRVKVELS